MIKKGIFRGFLFLFVIVTMLLPFGRQVFAQEKPEVFVQLGHSHWVYSVAFSLDGRTLASGSWDNTIKLWDIRTGKEIKTLTGHSNGVISVAFSPDGRTLASASWDDTIKLWNIDTGKEIMTLTGHSDEVKSVAFSPDGRTLASGSGDGTSRIWDVNTGKEIAQFVGFKDGEWIVITPEGYYNASPNGDRYLNVRIGNNVYGIENYENYREAFYRPDLVKIALTGGSLKEFKNLADVKQPPIVEILDVLLSTAKDEIKVTLKLTDQGGGIGDVRPYLNGSAVVLRLFKKTQNKG